MKAELPAYQNRFGQTNSVSSLFDIFGEKLQEIETVAFQVLAARTLKVATKKSLEDLGNLVGQPKPLTGSASTNDDSYRALIYAKIASNTSQSTRTDIISILKILGENLPKLRDLYPATLKVQYAKSKIASDFLTVAEVKNILQNASAPINLEVSRYTDTPFGFADDINASGFDVGELSEGVTE
jgi:hypothetical protein